MKRRLHSRKPGIRMQLAILYGIVFTILLLLSDSIFVLNIHKALLSSLDTTLQLRSMQIASNITLDGNTIILHDSTGELSGLIDNDEIPGLINGDVTGTAKLENFNYNYPNSDMDLDALVRILGPSTEIDYITPAFKMLNIPAESITQSPRDTPWLGTIITRSGQSARIYSMPLLHDGKIFGLLQVGASLSSVLTTLNRIILELLFVAPIVLLGGAMGSYWLTTRAFQPIERLIYIARTIKAGDLHQRVPIPQTNDEIQRLALTFNEMLDTLEQMLLRQRRFTADASHELRTPVAAIRSMTDVALAQKPQQDEYTTVLRNVNGQAERLGHLISELLTLARADEGYIVFEQEPVRLDLLATDVVETMQWLAAERGISLQVQADTLASVIGDEARLIQTMMNLLDNGLNYTSEGGEVVLSIEKTSTAIYLRVRDTGIGIAPEHIKHIFERFYRTNAARSRASGGSGLGLSIVEWVVHKHHGTIAVDSQPGHGTTFTIILPPISNID